MSKIKFGWTVDNTKTRETDLRIIQGHYPWAVKTDLGDHIALVKSQSEAKTGFAKAGTLNDRDEGYAIAELISAAPELFSVVEALWESWMKDGRIKHPHIDMEIIQQAGKALRKAKPN